MLLLDPHSNFNLLWPRPEECQLCCWRHLPLFCSEQDKSQTGEAEEGVGKILAGDLVSVGVEEGNQHLHCEPQQG